MRLTVPFAAFAALLSAQALGEGPAGLATAEVQYRAVAREYGLDGVVEAVNRTTVSAQTQGQVEEILYDVNDYVEKGAVIVRLKDIEHRAQVVAAAADLKSATAKLIQARDDQERNAGLFAKQLVSDAAMDQADTTLEAAQAAFEAAQAHLQRAQEQLRYTEIRAPYSGIVTERHVQVGETASPGSPLMSGISLEDLRVTVDVPQSVIPAVRGGAAARIYLADGSAIEARQVTVFPFADARSSTFQVRLSLPPGTESLFPGMLVKSGFVTGERRELAVPKEAVVFRSEVTGVYVVADDGRVGFRQVRLGRATDGAHTVLAGLSEGEKVATDPIAAGVALKSQQAAARGEAGGQDG